jgi:membrane protein
MSRSQSKAVRWLRIARRYGANAVTLGGLSARELAAEVWAKMDRDDTLGRAAQLSYYFLLAIFPLLLFISALIGYFFAAERELYQRLLAYLGQVMPQPAFQLLRATLNEITEGTGAGKMTLGLLLSLWAASAGMDGLILGLNVAYAVPEGRPWWRRRLVAITLTLVVGALISLAMFLILVSTALAGSIGSYFPLLERIGRLSGVAQWTIGGFFLLLALALIFHFGPNLRRPHWEANLPGAILSLVCWVGASAGFKVYVSFFGSFDRTYGSLGAVIVLLIWLYVSGAAILIGGELNSVIWQAVKRKRDE